jgi:DNA polymerase IIIc chi subunit
VVRVITHPLPGSKRARGVVEEIVRLYGDRRRVVVWVAADERRAALDEYLWNFEKLAFVPHLVWTEEMGAVEDPVVIVGEAANPNRGEALVVADDPPPASWVGDFDEVHDFIVDGDEGAERDAWWRRWREEHG